MKILHLLGATDDTGGILTVLRNLQMATAGSGHQHVVWVNTAYKETRGPPLVYRRTHHLLAESPSHRQLLWGGLRSLGELRRLVREEGFDVLHGHSRGALVVCVGRALVWRQPVVFTNHAYARRLGLYRWAAGQRRLVTTVLTPNMARHYRLNTGPGGAQVVSECCADRFFGLPLVEAPPRPRRVLVGLGNLVRWKNWHLLLEAIARLTPAERQRLEFHHWGVAPADPDSQEYAAELGQRVAGAGLQDVCRFHGLSLAVETVLRDAHWFALPSTNEPCSVALIEALALGLPALVSASGGNVDIVENGRTGLWFQPDDLEDLTRALRRILHDDLGLAPPSSIRDSVRHRSASVIAAQYLDLYQQLLRPPKTAIGRIPG